jgi:hypothetical protein
LVARNIYVCGAERVAFKSAPIWLLHL